MPAEIFEQANYVNKPIFLEHLVSLIEQAENKPSQLTTLLLLLRFVDAIDIGKWRVGEHTEKSLKLDVNQRDCEYLFKRLEQEVMKISDTLPKDAKKTFETLFYEEVVKNLRMSRGIPDHIKQRQNAFSDNNSIGQALSVWHQVTEYLTFIVATKSHFDLHAVFDRVDMEINRNPSGGITLTIAWTANRPIEWLKNRYIHEPGGTNKTLPEHILGTKSNNYRDGYIAKELLAGGEHLKELILGSEDNIEIKIKGYTEETVLNRETLQIQ
ncbi:MAG: hypothetical protein GY795_37545 [Desulfobacterales bacterium]|nr:hypothetical protein [Desulfobacterales bacterium]